MGDERLMGEQVKTTTAEAAGAICAECGGVCCRASAGSYWPEDVPMDVDRLLELARHNDYAIDWYDGDVRSDGDRGVIYWIRPAHINAVGQALDPSWGGVCVHLAAHGCRLSPGERPTQCRKLIPLSLAERERCGGCRYEEGYGGKESAAHAWLPHQSVMDEVVRELETDAM